MSKYTGFEIVPFGRGASAYGFGLLQQRGYIDHIPSVVTWEGWDTTTKRDWVIATNDEITLRAEQRQRLRGSE